MVQQPGIRLDRTAWPDFATGISREWIQPNGLGGYASATIIGANVRRYHGLLLVDLGPPQGLTMLLNEVEEVVSYRGNLYALSTHQYPGTVHPQGYLFLDSFELNPFPCFTYRLGEIRLQKRILTLKGRPLVGIEYSIPEGVAVCSIGVRPLINYRHYHHLTRESPHLRPLTAAGSGELRSRLTADSPWIHISHNAGEFVVDPIWNRRVQYPIEMERGLDAEEDLFCPGYLHFQLSPGEKALVVAATDPMGLDRWDDLVAVEEEQRRKGVGQNDGSRWMSSLGQAFEHFMIEMHGRPALVAGYPWFGEWGRDSMIALSRVPILPRWKDHLRSILLAYSEQCDHGMLPNVFTSDATQPAYNEIDASLWYFEAVQRFVDQTLDRSVLGDFALRAMACIVAGYRTGTRFGIRVAEDALVEGGDSHTQLTWMDAKVGNQVITSRHGKAVEVNALWYNALKVYGRFLEEAGRADEASELGRMAELAKESFLRLFWMEAEGRLKDCVSQAGDDLSMRPNQIMSASLTYPLLSPAQARRMVDAVSISLLTPYGLRTLAREDARYRGAYAGPPEIRDRAYHQGTVWPWLTAELARAIQYSAEDKTSVPGRIQGLLDPFIGHLDAAGLGSISEIFDGDPPHMPRGCPFQMWSVTSVLHMAKMVRSLGG